MKNKPEKKPKHAMDPISWEIRKHERRAINIAQKITTENKRHDKVIADLKAKGEREMAVRDSLRKNLKAL